MTREQAHKLIDELFDAKEAGVATVSFTPPGPEAPAKVLPEGKRVVRTSGQGDKVFLLDEVKKQRQWVTSPEALEGTGFDMGDVAEITDAELIKYSMAAALHKSL